jgi:Anticodon binding domain
MDPEQETAGSPTRSNPFSAEDVERILRARFWLTGDATLEMEKWMQEAAALLGPLAASDSASREASEERLADLLALIFSYDAGALLSNSESHAVLAREGAAEVIRELANRILENGAVDSERFREIVDAIKESSGIRSRGLFHPIRLALAGRAGDGELDRVILLLDGAATARFHPAVKGTRQRILEFCANLG